MREGTVVLITGASSGFGEAAARLLAARGPYRVFGTSRRAAGDDTLGGAEMLPLDVRSDASVAACVDAVMQRAGRIDVLVNNAGYTLAGAVEETAIDEAKAQFDTNFFGMARMVRAVLPVMRAQGGGRIVNVSSLAGLVGVPFHAHDSASKFAIEGLSEGLRQEVRRFGIHVSLIEPGDFKTAGTAARERATGGLPAYAAARDRAIDIMARAEQSGPDPRKRPVYRVVTPPGSGRYQALRRLEDERRGERERAGGPGLEAGSAEARQVQPGNFRFLLL
ncbi:SDR family NAD(P)-dependent oxidoreductase [Nannocystis sp. RBIL2]|uniref:SDR family NAD(P)-dependent oxidoreductase n=1 Tax=Nannocystis sp. RBIL2 TaxID=2996788 RepID=UPI00226E488E|nr:SDR family NAD(P)-dependent oxidoreductase [Nannocystis sp. RBIL2]MCY1065034.1 SDR family NAD(P)-dependent oxidoreductase [Nannocystis sp. RBIL2]